MATRNELKQISVYLDPEEVYTLEEFVLQYKRAGLSSPLTDDKTPSRNDFIRWGVQKVIKELQGQVKKPRK